jgi:hypothetical protein
LVLSKIGDAECVLALVRGYARNRKRLDGLMNKAIGPTVAAGGGILVVKIYRMVRNREAPVRVMGWTPPDSI